MPGPRSKGFALLPVHHSKKGSLYAPAPEATDAHRRAKRLCHRYNQEPVDLSRQVLAELLGQETNAHIEAPIRCDYGYTLQLGRNFYANYNFTVLDCAPVSIGNNELVAPNVVLSTAGHPVGVAPRVAGWEFARPIRIEGNVWLGAGVLVLPGVTIGAGTTIGAGSVATRDIAAGGAAVGNPCRVIRTL